MKIFGMIIVLAAVGFIGWVIYSMYKESRNRALRIKEYDRMLERQAQQNKLYDTYSSTYTKTTHTYPLPRPAPRTKPAKKVRREDDGIYGFVESSEPFDGFVVSDVVDNGVSDWTSNTDDYSWTQSDTSSDFGSTSSNDYGSTSTGGSDYGSSYGSDSGSSSSYDSGSSSSSSDW